MISLPRLRRWTLLGAPILMLSGRFYDGAGLMLWIAGGALLLPGSVLPYPGKKRPMAHRLFFAWAAGSACMAALCSALGSLILPGGAAPLRLGAACLSVIACERALALPLPRKLAWGGGAALSALYFIVYK